MRKVLIEIYGGEILNVRADVAGFDVFVLNWDEECSTAPLSRREALVKFDAVAHKPFPVEIATFLDPIQDLVGEDQPNEVRASTNSDAFPLCAGREKQTA